MDSEVPCGSFSPYIPSNEDILSSAIGLAKDFKREFFSTEELASSLFIAEGIVNPNGRV